MRNQWISLKIELESSGCDEKLAAKTNSVTFYESLAVEVGNSKRFYDLGVNIQIKYIFHRNLWD